MYKSDAEWTLQVREYEYDPEHQQESKAASESLRSDTQAKRSQLEEWSATAYGEVSSTASISRGMTLRKSNVLSLRPSMRSIALS